MWPVSALQEQATWCSTNDLKIKGTKEEENKGDKRRRTSHAFLIVLKKGDKEKETTEEETCFSNSLENKGDKEKEKSRSARVAEKLESWLRVAPSRPLK